MLTDSLKKVFVLTSLLLAIVSVTSAQNPGDTIKVRTFHYGSTNRDTLARFPSGSLTFEKIIMKYSMRCKNGLISNGSNRNQGCGEWDYSCNTYIVDSTKIEEVVASQPNYVVSNFSGTTFPYTSQTPYDYYRYSQQNVVVDNTVSEEAPFTVNSGSASVANVLKTDEHSGRSQVLYTAAELATAGVTTGDLNALILNVTNNGGWAHFLKVKIKHTTADSVDARSPELTGYTEVYNSDYHFVNGDNRIQFKTPFNWDGVHNIIVEFSYTNSVASTPVVFMGHSGSSRPMALFANNNYAVDLMNAGNANLDVSNLASISNEITIAFWAYGNASMMPANTMFLYGHANNVNDRQVNIHLPHSNGNIYFDCGFAGGYDRLFKASVASEQGGRWNHWTFTKNAQTGNMKIFLNGVLWTSATGMTKPVSILKLILGTGVNGINNYKGRVSELAIWNKELPDATVAKWMKQPANVNHPMYANLVSYYPLNEGTGQAITNEVTSVSVTGNNLAWTYERGDTLNRGFTETNLRPTVQFVKGVYQQTVTNVTVTDSVRRNPVIVNKYSIISQAGVVPIKNDIVKLDTIYTNYYATTSSKIYNGETGALIDSVVVSPEGQLEITNLTYYQRYPFYNEIMSFVTPYGLGLDLGMEGKSWFFDVSDFAPLLKGDKRILMTLGGQNQEQNDIEFWFIVGTPPRTVLEFNQIWQGTNRTGIAPIGDITSNKRFPAVDVPLLSTGQTFKVRSSITGHGSNGEFESNGGPINHMLNLQGGNPEFVWSVSRPCSMNPVFPQGGTWIYARQGWCPGEATLLFEHDITSMVSPGASVNIDYTTSQPLLSTGDYSYQVAHQMVTYGPPIFQTDARLMDVVQPTNKIVYGRTNPGCAGPKVVIQNTGSNVATSMEIKYWINNNAALSYTWNGNLAFMQMDTIDLPVGSLWNGGTLADGNMFYAEITKVNNQTDQYTLNNKIGSAFKRPDVVPQNFTIEFRTNNRPQENSFKLLDVYGNIVDQKSFTTANTINTATYNLIGCYKLVVDDLGEDGVSFWANSSQGTGFVRLKRSTGTVIKTFEPDFGARFEYAFTTNWAMATEEVDSRLFGAGVVLFPNPSNGTFRIEGDDIEGSMVSITDVSGRIVMAPIEVSTPFASMNQQSLKPGVYFVVIQKNGQRAVKELMIH